MGMGKTCDSGVLRPPFILKMFLKIASSKHSEIKNMFLSLFNVIGYYYFLFNVNANIIHSISIRATSKLTICSFLFIG